MVMFLLALACLFFFFLASNVTEQSVREII